MHSTKELRKAQLAIIVLVEVFQALGNFELNKGNAERGQGVAELFRVQRAVAILVELLEEQAESAQAVCLLGAGGHELGADLRKVRHVHGLLVVGVTGVEVTAACPHHFQSALLLVKIDVAFERQHGLRLVQRLREASRDGEGVRASGSTHVCVLTLKSLGVDCYGSGLSVISAGNSSLDFLIGQLLLASPDTSFNDQLLVAISHGNFFTILRYHNFASDNVFA